MGRGYITFPQGLVKSITYVSKTQSSNVAGSVCYIDSTKMTTEGTVVDINGDEVTVYAQITTKPKYHSGTCTVTLDVEFM